jgi:hypothetical protein
VHLLAICYAERMRKKGRIPENWCFESEGVYGMSLKGTIVQYVVKVTYHSYYFNTVAKKSQSV